MTHMELLACGTGREGAGLPLRQYGIKFRRRVFGFSPEFDASGFGGGNALLVALADLMAVALREAKEETGLQALTSMCPGIYALEVVCVNSHVKRGRFVSSHLHLDCCYLWQADEAQALRVKPDENSGVAWIPIDEVERYSTEPEMWPIYRKLNAKLSDI